MKHLLKFLPIILLCSYSVQAQQDNIEKVPTSIYTFNLQEFNKNSPFELHNYLNLNNNKFLILESVNFKENQLTINSLGLKTIPTSFFKDFISKEHEKNILQRSFFNVNSLYDLPRQKKNF